MILLREQRKLYQKPSPTSNESRTRRQHSSCLFPKVLIGYTEQEDDIVMMKKKIQLDRSSSEFVIYSMSLLLSMHRTTRIQMLTK